MILMLEDEEMMHVSIDIIIKQYLPIMIEIKIMIILIIKILLKDMMFIMVFKREIWGIYILYS